MNPVRTKAIDILESQFSFELAKKFSLNCWDSTTSQSFQKLYKPVAEILKSFKQSLNQVFQKVLGNPSGRHSADDPETKLANLVEDLLTEFVITASLFQVSGESKREQVLPSFDPKEPLN